MITGEAKHTRCVMGRLEKGEDVVLALVELARFERIDAGFVRGQGAVEDPALLHYDAGSRGYRRVGFAAAPRGAWELVSLAGNVSLLSGAPAVRLWSVIARAGQGGHEVAAGLLERARAAYVEFAIDVMDDGDLDRRDDPATGLALWRPPRRR